MDRGGHGAGGDEKCFARSTSNCHSAQLVDMALKEAGGSVKLLNLDDDAPWGKSTRQSGQQINAARVIAPFPIAAACCNHVFIAEALSRRAMRRA